jgi:RNA polymerase sigma-70 factor (ECF subfamily)
MPVRNPGSDVPARRVEPLSDAGDAQLVAAMLQGDPVAPRAVWERFAPLVRRIVRRSLGPSYDIEDVVQDVFLRLFDRIGTLRDPSALRAFLVSIAMLSVRGEIRRRRVRRMVGLAPASQLAELRAVSTDHAAREALSRFYELLDRLNARERAAFVLCYIEEMSDSEVASALGVSIPTVRRVSARGYERVMLLARRDPSLIDFMPAIVSPLAHPRSRFDGQTREAP